MLVLLFFFIGMTFTFVVLAEGHFRDQYIIKESDCGLTCIPQNEKNLAETIIAISKLSDKRLNEMGKNGLKFLRILSNRNKNFF